MPEDRIGPITQSERIDVLDVLRGLAICSILIGNMQWFSGYGMVPHELAIQAPLYDRVSQFLVHTFIEGKFYSIFSLLFGFGFALQIARAEERGDTNASLFKRRLAWLLIIGLLHAWLLWPGDILSIYAVMGFLLILFRKKPNVSLLKWAGGLIVVPIVTALLLWAAFVFFAPPGTAQTVAGMQLEGWPKTVATVSGGNYFQIARDYNFQFILGRYAGLIFQMRLPKILAMFLLGFYAYRAGYFQNFSAHRVFFRKVMIYGLLLGVTGNLIFASLAHSEADFPPSLAGLGGVIAYAFAVPALALGIAAFITMLWQNPGWKKPLGLLAPVGRMALTNYLLQTVTCVIIFYGYGFGWFGRVGALEATLLALAIFAVQILLSNIWLRYFAYGPMEWIWRQLTYGRRLNLRRESLA